MLVNRSEMLLNTGMLFLENKYSRWYFNIINRAKVQEVLLDGYYEKHHIVPRSLKGNNCRDNLVNLTAREHFICHWLLTKMTCGESQKKMAYACKRMMHSKNKGQDRYQIKSSLYEKLKIKMNLLLKNRKFTPEWKAKLKTAAKTRANTEDLLAKQIRRDNMIKANKSRIGEKRPWMTGENNYFFGKSLARELNHFYGKNHTEETLKRLRVPKTKIQCPHCNKVIGGHSNYQRWHGDNCKIIKETKCLD